MFKNFVILSNIVILLKVFLFDVPGGDSDASEEVLFNDGTLLVKVRVFKNSIFFFISWIC